MSAANASFGDCKNANLVNTGTVQKQGALVAVHADSHSIEYCSANTADLLGLEPAVLLGKTGSEWLSTRWAGIASMAGQQGSLAWEILPGVQPLVVIGHRSGAHLVLEFEPAGTAAPHWWNYQARAQFVQQLAAVRTAEQCCELLVSWVFERSGFDRVLMYRFLPDWDGEVVFERCRVGIPRYLGLRFPASDIPANARRLFTLNWQRAIVDVEAESSPILKFNGNAPPLDLTYSTLRCAHPVHIQYLKNMGVQATLTLSVLVNGKLWALVAAHHLSLRALSIEDRLAFEEMARMLSLQLSNLVALLEQGEQADKRRQLSLLQGAMSTAADDARFALSNNLGMISRTFNAGGAWLRFEGEDFFTGLVPDKVSLPPLRDYIEQFSHEEVAYFHALPETLQRYRALVANASGMLFIPLSSTDFIALVRPEVIDTVTWAGKPQSEDEVEGLRSLKLAPRESFAAWSEKVRNTSEPWTWNEVESAARLRLELQRFLGNARLEHIALHDPLTGLANRLLFERRLQQEVRNAMSRNTVFAVHMIDLDRFKAVNDTLGHQAGDRVLTQTAARLMSLMQPEDTVARLGGDEFAVIQTRLKDSDSANATAQQIVTLLSQPTEIMGQMVEVGASVGIAMCPSDTVEEGELVECADIALYEVKRGGRNAYSSYAPGMRAGESRSTADGDLLAGALRNHQFLLKYQPIIDARSGELRGLEAFLSWRQPGVGDIPAGEFMPLVIQRRLSPAVSEWVMDAVFAQYQQWLREGLATVPVAINIGAAEFASQDLLAQIEKIEARYDTGWQWLRLDIKEETLVADIGYAMRVLEKLRAAGVGANLDNVGRGFVPLGHLTQLPFLGIKLDGLQFERKNDRQYFDAFFNIVQGIAQVFSAKLTVTRVETAAMREALSEYRVDLLQGNGIAPPAEAEQAANWLRFTERF